jgi:acyl-CoA synthetase (AMP-forming)/AMP-acid ligase II
MSAIIPRGSFTAGGLDEWGDMTTVVRDVVGDSAGRIKLWAELTPDHPAIIDDRGDGSPIRTVSYAELDRLVNRIANALHNADIKQGERVAWMGRNSVEVIAFINAAMRAGVSTVALNHRMRSGDAYGLLNFANASLLWVEADAAGQFGEITSETPVRTVVVYDGEPSEGQLSAEKVLAAEPDTPPPTVRFTPLGDGGFTSGTTGKPKRVMRDSAWGREPEGTHLTRVWGPDPHVFITSGSISSGSAGGYYAIALSRGDTIVLQRRFDAEDWMRLVDKYRVSFAYLAPTLARRVCALRDEVKQKYDISSIRGVLAGASKWSYALKLEYRNTFPDHTMWEVYGSTELASNTVIEPDDHWGRPESCGRAIDGVEIQLRAGDGSIVEKPSERGVVWVRSEFAQGFLGYDGDPDATAAAVDGEWRSVGDVAYFDEDGYYYICDRVKDMIVSGGVNVYPAEVEAVIDSFPGVHENAVFGIPDDTWDERVHAVVVPKPGAVLDADAIISYCRSHLASHKVPRSIDFLDELPHTVSGKVLKREVRNKYWEKADRLI